MCPCPGGSSSTTATSSAGRRPRTRRPCASSTTPGPMGRIMLQTCLLPQRERPYDLAIELARHRIKMFIAKCEEWQMFDLDHRASGHKAVGAGPAAVLEGGPHGRPRRGRPHCPQVARDRRGGHRAAGPGPRRDPAALAVRQPTLPPRRRWACASTRSEAPTRCDRSSSGTSTCSCCRCDGTRSRSRRASTTGSRSTTGSPGPSASRSQSSSDRCWTSPSARCRSGCTCGSTTTARAGTWSTSRSRRSCSATTAASPSGTSPPGSTSTTTSSSCPSRCWTWPAWPT